MTQPPSFVSINYDLVCKFHSSIYGLKQVLRVWYERLTYTLLGLGFIQSKCDDSLMTLKTKANCVYVLICVDDIIFTYSFSAQLQSVISKLHSEFAHKQLGNLEYFLEIEVKLLCKGSLILSQTKGIYDLLDKVGTFDAKGISTPLFEGVKLFKLGSDYMDDPTLYISIIGAL